MKSLSVVTWALLIVLCCSAVPVWAQDAPAPLLTPPEEVEGWPTRSALPFIRGGGFYFSLYKIILLFGVFLAWIKFADFLNCDIIEKRQNYALWNPVIVGSFVAALLLFWILPFFWLGWPLLLIAAFAPGYVYALKRNPAFSRGESILTPEHFRRIIAGFGMKVETEKKSEADKGAKVKFTPTGAADDQKNQANLLLSRQNPGFVPAKDLIAAALDKRADLIMLDYSAAGVGVRFQIDGVWHSQPGQSRENFDPVLVVLKKIGNLNEQDRRSRQEVKYDVEYAGIKYVCKLTTQGVETGERAVIQLTNPKKIFKTLEEIGLRPKLLDGWKEKCREEKGFIIISAPPGGGFSTLYTVTLRECDRFLRDFVGIEDKHKREPDVENVPVTTYDSKAGESPATILPEMTLKYPNVYVLSEFVNAETLQFLYNEINDENRFVIGGVKAKESAEALLRVLMLKAPAAPFVEHVHAVINMRIVRKLCDKCKEAYNPAPELLKKLGLPPAQVPQLYRPYVRKAEDKKPPCEQCHEIGYFGRTGIIEVLLVGDNTRQALLKSPQLDAVRLAARKDGMKTLQEEGILLVAKGITSLDELTRALKG